MILLTLSRGKGEETVRLQLPASPAEIGEAFASLDRISLDTTATAILDVSSNVPVLYRCLYDVDVEDSEQFQKLQKLAERTEALSPAKAAIFSGALDAECVWNLEGALTVADRLDEYMLVNNVSSDSELGIYLVNKGITPFPDRFKPYINYARVGAEYREKHGGEYSSGNYVQKKTPELLENERLDGVFRIWMENPCPVRVQSETAQITLPATFEQLESARQLLGVDSLNMAKLTRVEALRPYPGFPLSFDRRGGADLLQPRPVFWSAGGSAPADCRPDPAGVHGRRRHQTHCCGRLCAGLLAGDLGDGAGSAAGGAVFLHRYVISKIHSSSATRNDTGGAAAGTIFIHRLCRTILFWRLTAMKKFHVTRKTVLTIVGVTLPLTAAAILLPRLKRSRMARSVRA